MNSWVVRIPSVVLAASFLFYVGCAGTEEVQEPTRTGGLDFASQPRRVKVQHVLIGFSGSVPGKSIGRSQDEAETLANEIYQMAKDGQNFDGLVRKHTDDSHPGIYTMVNHGQQGDPASKIVERSNMVPAFGDVSFSLRVGEVGLAEYGPRSSKFGWHIIKRIE